MEKEYENGKLKSQGASGELEQLVSFEIADEEYGLDILSVQEIVRMPAITTLPRTPKFIKGVINLRGNVIPLVDMRERFSLVSKAYDATTRVIVVEMEKKLVGLVVDTVSQVLRIGKKEIEPPPPVIHGLAAEYIRGVGKTKDGLIILLNLERILSDEEKIDLQGAAKNDGKAA